MFSLPNNSISIAINGDNDFGTIGTFSSTSTIVSSLQSTPSILYSSHSPSLLPSNPPQPSPSPLSLYSNPMQIHAPVPSPLALITHPMKTRSKNNIFKPSPNYALLNTPSPNLPIESTSVTQALKSPKWHKAMSEEFTTLIKNGTWELVPPHTLQNLSGCKWIFWIKCYLDGSIDRYKARFVAKDFHLQAGIDYHKTFSLVIKPTTVVYFLVFPFNMVSHFANLMSTTPLFMDTSMRMFLWVNRLGWLIPTNHHMYVILKRRFTNSNKHLVLGTMNWWQFFLSNGFVNSRSNTSLFLLQQKHPTIFVLVYVDNLIIIGCNPATVQRVVTQLRSKFSIKDLGTLSYFLGIKVLPTPVGAFFSQHKYIQYLLTIAKIDNADDMSTPMSPSA